MAKTLQFRRDTTTNLASVTGAEGELFVDTTKNTVVVMDGTTAGGHPLAVQGSDADFVTATIGDVYYANNIVSPIPTYANTAYGDVLVATPLVVNAPLEVLSFDTSNTAVMTFTNTFGYQSGGTNNTGRVFRNAFHPENGVFFELVQQITYADYAAFESLRVGDVVTCIGTNGFYTGSVSFPLTEIQLNHGNAFGQNYGPVILRGWILESDINRETFNANIITANRPYSTSTVAGTLSADVVQTQQVVSDTVTVGNILDVRTSLIVGATTERNAATNFQDVYSFMDYSISQVDMSNTNFANFYMSGNQSSYHFTGFNSIYLGERVHADHGVREVQILLHWDGANQVLNLPSTQSFSIAHPDHSSSDSYSLTVKWKDGTAPTAGPTTAGGFQLFKYKILFSNGEPTYVLASSDIYQ